MPKTYTTILGIHYGHDGGVAIVQNGKVVAAINEERMRNIKHYNGIPSFSLNEIFKISKIHPSEIDAIAIVGISDMTKFSESSAFPIYAHLYYTWNPITLNLRDDVNNAVSKLVGEQIQKQFDFFEQASAVSGIDYKFTARTEILDGGQGSSTPNVLETFELYGAYIESVNYNTLAYNTSDPATVTLSIRYDNAIQTPQGTGIGTSVARTVGTLATGGGQ